MCIYTVFCISIATPDFWLEITVIIKIESRTNQNHLKSKVHLGIKAKHALSCGVTGGILQTSSGSMTTASAVALILGLIGPALVMTPLKSEKKD